MDKVIRKSLQQRLPATMKIKMEAEFKTLSICGFCILVRNKSHLAYSSSAALSL